jgi:aspartyl-tRNA(Asn)/glutamyl-tRNA(Gln) amidotransferase subunit A
VAIKDEAHVKGLPTRGGTSYLRAEADDDAWAVERLRAAGAIIVGKTHCPEWGLNPLGFNEHFSMPRNAWSNAHGAGGSSTGTAVAVALGLASVGLASDGGGSIRIPSSLNGVFGIKPTWQRVGRSGDIWGSGTMPHVGPIGASTADCVAFLAATAARDPGDPATWLQSDLPDAIGGWWRALGRGVKGCRIGVLRGEWAEAPAELAAPAMAALHALEREGAVLVDVDLPLAALCPGIGALSIAPETSANIDDDMRAFPERFTDELRIIHAFMSLLTSRERLLVQRTRAELRHQTARAMAGVDLLALPTMAMGAAHYPLTEDRVGVMDSAATARTTRFAFLANLTGLPAASVPVGLCDGRPVGLQLIGDAWDEASVFAAMAHLERVGVTHIGHSPGWHDLAG